MPTLAAAAGAGDVVSKFKAGTKLGGETVRAHLDGYNFLPYLTGAAPEGPRKEFFYFTDEGDLAALRYENWKVHFLVQDQPGTLEIWQREFRPLRTPLVFNLRTDPYEAAPIISNTYWDWMMDHSFVIYPMGDVIAPMLQSMIDFPPAQKAGSFTIGDAFERVTAVPQR
jgi:arylsulfatase